ncbi:MAG: adenylate/guanylate cyclase domain-containing protein [Deltaproteobacteria bacterium]|nr:adenylate/guanylate cyclase domain-containing protein [Deltaproteobacteria bacterium]
MKTALFRSPLVASLLVSVLVFLGVFTLRSLGSLEAVELAAYDWYLRLRPDPSLPDSRIVLITITETDIRNQGRWPLTDATLARALEILSQYQPRAIGLDLHRDVPVPPGREALEAILTSTPNIIVAEKFGHGTELGIPPPSVLENTDQVGFNDIVVDPGGIVRRGLLFLDDGVNVSYAFALRLALLYLQVEGITPQPDVSNPQYIRLGHMTIRPLAANDGGYVGADTRGYQFLLDFREIRGSFPSFSLTALLSGEIAPEVIKDKIVLVGVAAESVKDFFYTPYSRGLYVKQQIPGIALHAQIVSQLLRSGLEGSAPVATLSEWYEGGWVLLWSMLGGISGLWVRSPWRFLLLAASGLLILSLVVYWAFLHGWWIPLVPPAIAWLLSATILTAYMSNQEKGQRALLMQLFAKHVSPEIAEAVWQQREQFLRGGRPRSQELMVTVLFSDLKGFTSVSEKMTPQALMDWLNIYAEAMAQLVIEHGGVIDDYAGDGLMANFGVPLARTTEAEIGQDAKNAVNCALAMERELNRLNILWQEQNLPTMAMRVGIFTGPAVAGSLGSAQRLKYTIVGDTVNIASRLESFDKDLVEQNLTQNPCRILIGEATLQYLDEQFKTQRIGEVSLKGKEQKITVYRVVGREDFSS